MRDPDRKRIWMVRPFKKGTLMEHQLGRQRTLMACLVSLRLGPRTGVSCCVSFPVFLVQAEAAEKTAPTVAVVRSKWELVDYDSNDRCVCARHCTV